MKVAFHTLGCKVNQYETEAIKEKFAQRGHRIVGEEDFADVYVINTCSVTNLAERKSRQYIRRMKRINPESLVAVTGCYAQVEPDEVSAIQGVDLVVGINEKHRLCDYVEGFQSGDDNCHILDYDGLREYQSDGIVSSMENRTRAYIKIQEGCNRFCSYCIIPYARGPVRSRDLDEIVMEAKMLIASGFKEIVLTGINTALYGADKGMTDISHLIASVDSLEGDFRIRLSSLEPTVINADYVKELFQFSKLCHHLHLSIQSGSDSVLSAMNRRYTREEYMNIVQVLRNFDPLYGITTDIIAGFPGESDEDVESSMDIMHRAKFCKVHIFRYSKRKGTKAAEMANQVDGKIGAERSRRLGVAASQVEKEFLTMNLGTRQRILIEEKVGGTSDLYSGYSDNYIKTYVRLTEPHHIEANIGEFVTVTMKELYRDGMKGEIYE